MIIGLAKREFRKCYFGAYLVINSRNYPEVALLKRFTIVVCIAICIITVSNDEIMRLSTNKMSPRMEF